MVEALQATTRIRYSERISYCPPLITEKDANEPKLNDSPDALWKTFNRKRAILQSLPGNWHVIFPDGNYMPEDSEDTHLMISPDIVGEFSSVKCLPVENLVPISNMLLKFIKIAGPEGMVGYNVGPDHSRLPPQSWDNLHIHMIERGQIEYRDANRKGDLPKKLLEPARRHITSVAQFVLRGYCGEGINKLVPAQDGIFNGFPTSGAIAELRPNISGEELVYILKHIDNLYSRLHQQVFSAFAQNYHEAVVSHGVVPFKLRTRKEIIAQLEELNQQANPDGELDQMVGYLLKLGKPDGPLILKDWSEYVESAQKNDQFVDTRKKILTPPSYSVSLAHRGKLDYLVFAPHILREAGSQDILGTLTPRVYRDTESLDKRRHRAQNLAARIIRLFD